MSHSSGSGGGAGGRSQQAREQIASDRARRQLVQDFTKTFTETEHGKRTLRWLMDRYYVFESTEAVGDTNGTSFMNGERNVVLQILDILDLNDPEHPAHFNREKQNARRDYDTRRYRPSGSA